MAVVNQTIMDTRYKTIIKTTFSGTNTDEVILDASDLVGYVGNGSILNLAAINWSVNGGTILLEWDTSKTMCYLDGNGKMGGANGMAAFPNNATPSVGRGDIRLTSVSGIAGVGFLVIVCHKVETVVGHGDGWTAD